MINCRFVPIEVWPQEKTKNRQGSPFSVKYVKLLDDLEEELKKLGARDTVIQAELSRDDIRNDGWPKSNAVFRGPGVILGFVNRKGQEISFPCDTYYGYQANLRAISLTLTALRSIDRYGVSKHAEQYKGWATLPPAPRRMDPNEALMFVALHGNGSAYVLPKDAGVFQTAYRAAAKQLHPDSVGTGGHEQFVRLQQAAEVVKEAYGW